MDHGYRLRDMPVSMPPNVAASREWAERRAVAARPAPSPAPEHTSRDPWPDDVGIPGGAKILHNLAVREGWWVQATYARGTWVSTGKRCESVAVRCTHPGTLVYAVVMYRRRAADGDVTAGEWLSDSMIVRAPDDVMHSVTRLELVKELLQGGGEMPDGWLDRVRRARADQDAAKRRAAERAKARRAEKGAVGGQAS